MNTQNHINGYAEAICVLLKHGITHSKSIQELMDPMACLIKNCQTSSGNASWSKLKAMAPKSVNASSEEYKNTIGEHMVPRNEIINEIKRRGITPENVIGVVSELWTVVVITKEEDALLNDAGYRRVMPDEYFDETNELYKNKFARYIKVGIIVE